MASALTPAAINMERINIALAPLDSLFRFSPTVSEITLHGIEISFTHTAHGNFQYTSNLPINLSGSGDAATWLSNQSLIKLQDTRVSWQDQATNTPPQILSNVNVQIRRGNKFSHVQLHLDLPKEYGESLALHASVRGDLRSAKWLAHLHARIENPNWQFGDFLPVAAGHSPGILELQMLFANEKFQSLDARMTALDTVISSNGESLRIDKADIGMKLKRMRKKDWALAIKTNELRTEHGVWDKAQQYLLHRHSSPEGHLYSGALSYVNIADTLRILRLSPHTRPLLAQLPPSYKANGELHDLRFALDAHNKLVALDTRFSKLGISDRASEVEIANLDGALRISADGTAQLDLASEWVRLRLPKALATPMNLDQLNAQINWRMDGTQRLIHIPRMDFSKDGSSIRLIASLLMAEEDLLQSELQLLATVEDMPLAQLHSWLPLQMDEEARAWFKDAFLGGSLDASALWRGQAADFPFNKNQGVFQTEMHLNDITLKYEPTWPALKDFSMNLEIDNHVMRGVSTDAHIRKAHSDALKVSIEDLSADPSLLVVEGTMYGNVNDARHFIKNSPLAEIGRIHELLEMNISGDFALDLTLDIPLSDEPNQVNGKIALKDILLEHLNLGLGLQKINGTVHFDNDSASGQDLAGIYSLKPVRIHFSDGAGKASVFGLGGTFDKDFLLSQLLAFYPKLATYAAAIDASLNGKGTWQLDISTPLDQPDLTDLKLSSNLHGFSLDLPKPLGKETDEARAFTLKARLHGDLIHGLDIRYGDSVHALIELDNTEDLQIKGISIGLNQETTPPLRPGILSIYGELEHLEPSAWIISSNGGGATDAEDSQESLLLNADLRIGQLHALGNVFTDVAMQAQENAAGDLLITTQSQDIKEGKIVIPLRNADKPVAVQIKHLSLAEGKDSDVDAKEPSDPRAIPSMRISIDKLVYHGNEMGSLEIVADSTLDGLLINDLKLKENGFTLQGSGKWKQRGDTQRSEFALTASSESINEMLAALNYRPTNIQESATTIHADFAWDGSPMDFSLQDSTGNISIDMQSGIALEVKNNPIGRIFGLLSIAALPRRLLLDFSDLFSEGLAFDSITGTFEVKNGNAFTKDLSLTSPAVGIVVFGRIGLVQEDYDQIAIVTPSVSETLPLLSALLGPVGIGVGLTWWLSKKISDDIPDPFDNLLKAEYRISGEWENPVIEQINADDVETFSQENGGS
ncbi:MAG: YhdP family phospholipid transporter [Candidatus Eutrophobiaceae bacterium]